MSERVVVEDGSARGVAGRARARAAGRLQYERAYEQDAGQ